MGNLLWRLKKNNPGPQSNPSFYKGRPKAKGEGLKGGQFRDKKKKKKKKKTEENDCRGSKRSSKWGDRTWGRTCKKWESDWGSTFSLLKNGGVGEERMGGSACC